MAKLRGIALLFISCLLFHDNIIFLSWATKAIYLSNLMHRLLNNPFLEIKYVHYYVGILWYNYMSRSRNVFKLLLSVAVRTTT